MHENKEKKSRSIMGIALCRDDTIEKREKNRTAQHDEYYEVKHQGYLRR